MRNGWLKSAIALGAIAATASGVNGGPAGMTLGGARPSAKAVAAPPPSASWGPAQTTPSAQISPWKNPIQYFSAAMSETPVATTLRDGQPRGPVTRPTPPQDRISLNTPPGSPSSQMVLSFAQLAEQQGDVPQARHHLQRGLATWPNDVELLRAAARMEDRQGQLALAESLYGRAVATNPQHAGALNDLGLCLARQGKLEQSVQVIEQAIHLQPDKSLYRNNAATVLVEIRQDQKALAHLSAVHGPTVSNYNMGQLLVARGRSPEALAYFQTALQLEPGMQSAQTAIAQLNAGSIASPTQVAADDAAPARPVTPGVGPQLAPQQVAPRAEYPATARGPGFGTQSYAPQGGYYPGYGAPAPGTPVYRSANAPRYLPPVRPMAPGTIVR